MRIPAFACINMAGFPYQFETTPTIVACGGLAKAFRQRSPLVIPDQTSRLNILAGGRNALSPMPSYHLIIGFSNHGRIDKLAVSPKAGGHCERCMTAKKIAGEPVATGERSDNDRCKLQAGIPGD
jgi:hypothetical protein